MQNPKQTSLFGRRLKEARLKVNIPQDRLGVLIGVDEGAASARMSRYEAGVHEPKSGIVVNIAEALGVPTAYFYCEDDQLAKVLLSWEMLSSKERREVMKMVDDFTSKKEV